MYSFIMGVTTTSAKDDVYNFEKLSDFSGRYYAVEGGATLKNGSFVLVLKNSKGVVLNLKAEQKGVDLKLETNISVSLLPGNNAN